MVDRRDWLGRFRQHGTAQCKQAPADPRQCGRAVLSRSASTGRVRRFACLPISQANATPSHSAEASSIHERPTRSSPALNGGRHGCPASQSRSGGHERSTLLHRHPRPVKNLFDYLEGASSLEDFLEDFPSVSRERAVAVLEAAQEQLAAHAPAPCVCESDQMHDSCGRSIRRGRVSHERPASG